MTFNVLRLRYIVYSYDCLRYCLGLGHSLRGEGDNIQTNKHMNISLLLTVETKEGREEELEPVDHSWGDNGFPQGLWAWGSLF